MTAVALKNVDVAEVLSHKELVEKFEAALSQDAEAARIMENATCIEDMYKVASRYVEMKFEDFKAVCHKAASCFAEAKARLADDDMEYVIGGGFWSNIGGWIKNNWKKVVCVAVVEVFATALAATGVGIIASGILQSVAAGTLEAAVAGVVIGGSTVAIAGYAGYEGAKAGLQA